MWRRLRRRFERMSGFFVRCTSCVTHAVTRQPMDWPWSYSYQTPYPGHQFKGRDDKLVHPTAGKVLLGIQASLPAVDDLDELLEKMSTLDQTYAEIARTPPENRPSPTTFSLVDQLIREQGEDGIADWVVDSSPMMTPWESVAAILAIMIWSTSDNGTRIKRDAERWLASGADERRAFVAMNLDVYPFRDRRQMESVLLEVAAAFPNQAELCASMVASRNKLAEQDVGGQPAAPPRVGD